ncbi:MAG: dTMP kinase [Solirubrobacteraceae bacterium]
MARGRLITIEGLDGAGKTTLAVALGDALRARGVDAELLREPGGVRVAELIRELVKDPELRIGARSEALLYAAARAQLVDEALEPLLARGAIVLLDRFVDSSLAYQGAGRELGVERIREVNEFATGGLAPDLTLLLIVEPSVGRDRSSERSSSPDRLEREPDEFFQRIANAYRQLASANPQRILTIDATQSPEAVLAAALRAVEDLV